MKIQTEISSQECIRYMKTCMNLLYKSGPVRLSVLFKGYLGGLYQYQGFKLFVLADKITRQMLERGLLVPIILSWCFLELSLQVAVSLHVPAPLAAAACPCCPSCHGRRLMRTEQTGETGDSDARHRLRRHRRFCLVRHVFHNDARHGQRRHRQFCLVRHVFHNDV